MSYVADKFILTYDSPVVCIGTLSVFTFQNTGANTAVIQVSNDGVDYTDLLSLDSGAEKTVYNAYTYLKLASETTVFVSRGNVVGNGSVTLDSDNDVTTQQIQGLNERITTLESKPVLTETKVSELINTAVGNIPIGLPEQEVRNLITGATSNLVSRSHFEDVLADYLVTEQIETKINSAVATKADTDTVTIIQSDLTNLSNKTNFIMSNLDNDSLVADYYMGNADAWLYHYLDRDIWNITKHLKTTETGKVSNKVFRKDTTHNANCWVYNNIGVPNTRAYRISAWVRRSTDSTGGMHFNYRWTSPTQSIDSITLAQYSNLGNLVNQIPADEQWRKVSVICNVVNNANISNIFFGFAIGHTGSVGWWELQGFKVEPVLNSTDIDNTIATSLALQRATLTADTRNTNELPNWYWTNHRYLIKSEFKTSTVIGLTGFPQFTNLETRVYCENNTGGALIQIAYHPTEPLKTAYRHSVGVGTSATWSSWVQPHLKQFTDAEVKFLKDLYLKSVDTDRDGLSDYDEINVHRTSPTNPDTDVDEWSDGEEIQKGTDPNATNPRPNALFLNNTINNTLSKSGDNVTITMKLDINNKPIEPINVILEDSNTQTIRTERRIENLTYSGDKQASITFSPKQWLNEDVPNHGLSGSQYIRIYVNGVISGHHLMGASEVFNF